MKRLGGHFKRRWLQWSIALLSLAYVALQYDQFYNIIEWADTDDTLQYALSKSLSDGQWLGPYNRLILIKGIGFPAWTSLLHQLSVPLWFGNAVLAILGCLAIVYALRRTALHRGVLLFIFAALLFNPAITNRIYRDDIIPALTLLVCAWVIGLFVSLTLTVRQKQRVSLQKDVFAFTAIGLISLPMWYYTREDAVWLMTFVVSLLAISFFYCLWRVRHHIRHNAKALISVLMLFCLPFAAVQAVGVGIATVNERHYGRYVINDYFSHDFEDAYAALSRVQAQQPKAVSVPITTDMRLKLYEASPAFAQLKPCLDAPNMSGFCEGFKLVGPNKQLKDYEGGWFPFALRIAVEQVGYYQNPTAAHDYYVRLTNEVNTACDKGTLQCNPVHMTSLMPLPTKQIINILPSNLLVSFQFLLPLHLGGEEMFEPVQNPRLPYRDVIAEYYDARYTIPELGDLGQYRQDTRKNVHSLYATVNPTLFFISIAVLLAATVAQLRRRAWIQGQVIVIAWLVFAVFMLRIAMLTYVQTVSFPTIYPIYFASVYPLMFLLEGLAIGMVVSMVQRRRHKRHQR